MLAGASGTSPGLRLVRDEPERIILSREQPFRIGDAEFRPATREVLFDGRTSIVEPRVMQLLVALHRADGAVVSKDDLAALCWERRIVGEDAINRVVSRLRAVAEKRAGGQFRIETITKVGYRLVPANGEVSRTTAVETASPAESRLQRRDLLIGAGAAGAAIAAGLGWTLLRTDKMPPEARLLVEDARSGINQATIEQNAIAIGKLRRATELAPNSAEAWGLLALVYACSGDFAPADQRPNLFARAEEARRRAFAIEPDQGDALAAGFLTTPVFRNWYNCEQAGRAALSSHPDHPVLQTKLGKVLMQAGRYREALPLIESALRRIPQGAPALICRICALWSLGRFGDADAAVEHAYGLMPGQFGIWFTRLYYLMYNGRAREAVAMVDDVGSRPTGIPDWDYDLVALGAKAVAGGDRAAIRDAVSAWSAAATKGAGYAENAAIFAAFAGDVDEAFRMLGALYFNRGFTVPDLYFSKEQRLYLGRERYTHSLFWRPTAAIRRDPRFAQLTRELGLDDYWRRTNSRALVIA